MFLKWLWSKNQVVGPGTGCNGTQGPTTLAACRLPLATAETLTRRDVAARAPQRSQRAGDMRPTRSDADLLGRVAVIVRICCRGATAPGMALKQSWRGHGSDSVRTHGVADIKRTCCRPTQCDTPRPQAQTHRPDLADVSAARLIWLERQWAGTHSDVPSATDGTPVTADAPRGHGPRSARRRGGGGAWRAFVHRECRNRNVGAEEFSGLAVAYKQLDPIEKAELEELGHMGTHAHRYCSENAFCTPPRRTIAPWERAVRNSREEARRSGQPWNRAQAVAIARSEWHGPLAQTRLQVQQAAKARRQQLAATKNKNSDVLGRLYNLLRTKLIGYPVVGPLLQQGELGNPSPCAGCPNLHTLEWQPPVRERTLEELVGNLRGLGEGLRPLERWATMHKVALEPPRVAKAPRPPRLRLCQVVGRCVCQPSDHGRQLLPAVRAIQGACEKFWRAEEGRVGAVSEGKVVLSFTTADVPPQWYHISLLYLQTPMGVRPTFMRMEGELPRDGGSCVVRVMPSRGADADNMHPWVGLLLLAELLLAAAEEWQVQFWEVVAVPGWPLSVIQVAALGPTCALSLLAGAAPRARAARGQGGNPAHSRVVGGRARAKTDLGAACSSSSSDSSAPSLEECLPSDEEMAEALAACPLRGAKRGGLGRSPGPGLGGPGGHGVLISDASSSSSSSSSSSRSGSLSSSDSNSSRTPHGLPRGGRHMMPETVPVGGPGVGTEASGGGPDARVGREGQACLPVLRADGQVHTHIRHTPGAESAYVRCPACAARKTRTLRGAAGNTRVGRGRPLGFLAAWSLLPCTGAPEAHLAVVPPFEVRITARRALSAMAAYAVFSALERPCRQNEGSEPEDAP